MQKKKNILIISGIIGAVFLAIIIFLNKNTTSTPTSKRNNQPTKTPPLPSPSQEEQDDCPYDESSLTAFSSDYSKMRVSEEDLTKWRQIPRDYIIKLWKKGYHWYDIIQLRDWKIEQKENPDLKAEQRIGVINQLAVTFNWDEEKEGDYVGLVHKLVVIARKIPSGGPRIEVDENQKNDLPMMPDSANKLIKHHEKIINLVGQQKDIDLSRWEIFLLNSLGADRFRKEKEIAFGKIGGKSGGSTLYLAVLSALTRKPISAQVAATGAITANRPKKGKINGQEVNLEKGTNLPIKGLKEKVAACAEKGINRLVLSFYQSAPNLFTKYYKAKWRGAYTGDNKKIIRPEKWIPAEDYQALVPPEIKEKTQVYFAKNCKELGELFSEGKLA